MFDINLMIFFLFYRESLFNILSGLYALVLVIVGIALPVTEVLVGAATTGNFEVISLCKVGLYEYIFPNNQKLNEKNNELFPNELNLNTIHSCI